MRLYPLLYSYPIGVNAPILDKNRRLNLIVVIMRKTMGAAMPGKKSTRFRIVLTFKGYSYYR